MERGALERIELRSSRPVVRSQELLRHPQHGGLLLLRHHRHLHPGRWRNAVRHGERIDLPIAVTVRACLCLLPPCSVVVVQAIKQQPVEPPGL
jgi:hypothetical protein